MCLFTLAASIEIVSIVSEIKMHRVVGFLLLIAFDAAMKPPDLIILHFLGIKVENDQEASLPVHGFI